MGLQQGAGAGGVLLRPVRAAVRPARARALEPRACSTICLAVLVGLALVFAPWASSSTRPDRAAQPQGGGLQPARVLLPGQLAVLRPEHLRALPGRGDGRRGRGAAVDAAPADVGRLGAGCSPCCGRRWCCRCRSPAWPRCWSGLVVLGGAALGPELAARWRLRRVAAIGARRARLPGHDPARPGRARLGRRRHSGRSTSSRAASNCSPAARCTG